MHTHTHIYVYLILDTLILPGMSSEGSSVFNSNDPKTTQRKSRSRSSSNSSRSVQSDFENRIRDSSSESDSSFKKIKAKRIIDSDSDDLIDNKVNSDEENTGNNFIRCNLMLFNIVFNVQLYIQKEKYPRKKN